MFVFFQEMFNDDIRVFDRFLQPFEIDLIPFLVRKLPVNIRMAHFLGEMRKDDGGGVGNIEAFGEAFRLSASLPDPSAPHGQKGLRFLK